MKKLVTLLLPLLLLAAGVTSCGKPRPKSAVLTLSGPAGMVAETAGVEFRGQNIKLELPAGKHVFRFSAPGYRDDYRLVAVTPGRPQSLQVELARTAAAAVITSIPKGAQVTFRDKVMGITPLVIPDLPPGEYAADLDLRGHARTHVTWRITDERPVSVSGNLNSNLGRMRVTSTPTQARVFLDGVEVGETPYDTERAEGRYTVRVVCEGCNPVERSVDVLKNQRVAVHVKLSQRPGAIDVTSKPAGAEVFVNSEKRGVTPCSIAGLEPGEYTLRLVKPGYDPLSTKVKVVPATTDSKHYNLVSSTGSVIFNVSPAGVEVMLDGRDLGRSVPIREGASSTKDFLVSNLAPGTHELVLFHAMGRPQRRRVKFKVVKNQRITLENQVIWVANCEITYTDGTVVRGAIYSNEKDHVFFGLGPGVSYRIERDKIRSIKMLDGSSGIPRKKTGE